jgi:hypothetical protein
MPSSTPAPVRVIPHSVISSGVERVPARRRPQTALITGLQPLLAFGEQPAPAKGRTAMKIAVMLVLAGMGTSTRAQGELDATDSTVAVCVPEGTNYPGVNLYWAKKVASTMFAHAGVHIRWQAGQPESHQSQPLIVLSLTSSTPENFPPNIFAYAQVFEGVHIRIFVDHVVERAHRLTSLGTSLLAHVMVHEITHMLQGVNRHSQEGIMKATWTHAEIQRMVVAPLSFAPEDIRLIHAGLAEKLRAPKPLLNAASAVSSRASNREDADSRRGTGIERERMTPRN